MAETVSTLWIGESLGALGRLSLTSFLRQGHGVHLYCYDAVADVPNGVTLKDGNEILPASSIFCYEGGPGKGSVAAFANLFRYKLLLEKGGWWVDADIVCLKPFEFPEPVVFASEHARQASHITNAVMKLPAGHVVAHLCFEAAHTHAKPALRWGEIGPQLLDEVVTANGFTRFVQDARVFCPLPWWDWRLALHESPALCLSYVSEESCAASLMARDVAVRGVKSTSHVPDRVHGRSAHEETRARKPASRCSGETAAGIALSDSTFVGLHQVMPGRINRACPSWHEPCL